jgi:hypothetical protein
LFLPAVQRASEAGALADHLMVRARLLIVVFVAAGVIASGAGHALYRTLWGGAGYSRHYVANPSYSIFAV